jgi:hypothetical protein
VKKFTQTKKGVFLLCIHEKNIFEQFFFKKTARAATESKNGF